MEISTENSFIKVKVRFKVDLSVLGHFSVRLHELRNILAWIQDGFHEGALAHYASLSVPFQPLTDMVVLQPVN